MPSNGVEGARLGCPVWAGFLLWALMGTLPPADDSVSLPSFGGEGWGEEAVTPGGSCCLCLPQRLCPSPQPCA